MKKIVYKGARRLFLLLLALLLLSATVAGAAGPLNFSQNFGEDAKTSRFFCWQTQEDAPYAVLQYRRAEDNPDNAPETVLAQTEWMDTDAGRRASHKIQLHGLIPDTRYIYRIVLPSQGYYGEYAEFTTAPEESRPFSFIQFADSQSSNREEYLQIWGGTMDAALEKYPDVDFLLHTGDMVDRSDGQAEHWDNFFEAVQSELYAYPLLPLMGNHEYSREGTPIFKAHFALDEPAEIPSTYSYDFGNALLICLNTSGDVDTLVEFTESEIAEKGQDKWLIIALHIGLYSGSHHEDARSQKLRKKLEPVMDKYEVDIVLQGHDHIYMRSYPIRGGQILPAPQMMAQGKLPGTIYLIPFSTGSKVYFSEMLPWMQVFWLPEQAERKSLYNRAYAHISVSDEALAVDVNMVDGTLLDSFTLRR